MNEPKIGDLIFFIVSSYFSLDIIVDLNPTYAISFSPGEGWKNQSWGPFCGLVQISQHTWAFLDL